MAATISIRKHLRPYRMVDARKTTINHAFASALAIVDDYDEARVNSGLALLGVDPENVVCVYCDSPAETWDHLHGLVKNGRFAGRGHQIGNLVPACKSCNSAKGNSDWRKFAERRRTSPRRIQQIAQYEALLSEVCDEHRLTERYPDLMREYADVREATIELLRNGDVIAAKIQDAERSRRAELARTVE